MKSQRMRMMFMVSILIMFISSPVGIHSSQAAGGNSQQKLQLPQTCCPEDIAFDSKSEGPYTGVADGRILKFVNGTFMHFATTSPSWTSGECIGKPDSDLRRTCGRPLGLTFDSRTGELYIADILYGILKVGPDGGLATQVAAGVEGKNFSFANSVEIDESTGNLYFIDSGPMFRLMDIPATVQRGDASGRLLKYEAETGRVTVVLKGLAGPGGMAMSEDQTFIVISNLISRKVIKHYIKGPKANTTETLPLEGLEGNPGNVKRATNEGFWMAVNIIKEQPRVPVMINSIAVKFDENGKILTRKNITIHSPNIVTAYLEHFGRAYTGSQLSNFVGVDLAM